MTTTLTGYPLIRLTANRPLDIDGTHIQQGEIFFLVASLSHPDTSHLVRWNYERCRWDCTCPATVNNCRHIKQVSAYSAAHPYSATHPAGCPVVVKSAPVIVAEPAITQVDNEMWIYNHTHTVWVHDGELMGTDAKAVEAVKKLINPPCKVEEVKPVYRIVSTGTKRKRRDLLEEITQRAEHKSDILGEINEIKERSKKDMMNAPLTQNRAFSVLR